MSRTLRPRSKPITPAVWVRPRAERVVKPARPACFVAAERIAFPAVLALILAAAGVAVEVSRLSLSLPPEITAWVQVARSIGGLK